MSDIHGKYLVLFMCLFERLESDCVGQFMCGDGTPSCVNMSLVCDGYRDCTDGRDESNTTAVSSPTPKYRVLGQRLFKACTH